MTNLDLANFPAELHPDCAAAARISKALGKERELAAKLIC